MGGGDVGEEPGVCLAEGLVWIGGVEGDVLEDVEFEFVGEGH